MGRRAKGENKNYKTLREDMGVILCDLGLGNGFLDVTLKGTK